MKNYLNKVTKSISEEAELKEVLENVTNYYLLEVSECEATIIFDKNLKSKRMLNDINYNDTQYYFIKKENITRFEEYLEKIDNFNDKYICTECRLYNINDELIYNINQYLEDETDTIFYSDLYEDVLDNLKIYKDYKSASEQFEEILKN